MFSDQRHGLGVVYSANQVSLQIVDAGDYNGNGTVDAADYVVWRKGLGSIYAQTDYNVWRAHFGQTTGSDASVSANATVPEPASVMLIMCAVAGSCRRRNRAYRKSQQPVNM